MATPTKLDSLAFLVVDDEAFIRNLLVRILRQLGASKIEVAANGVQALAHLDAADPRPDVLLIDLSMPEMGGVELLNRLAERAYAGAVILVSGADRETLIVAKELAKSREVDVLGFIIKPVQPEALKEMLAKFGEP